MPREGAVLPADRAGGIELDLPRPQREGVLPDPRLPEREDGEEPEDARRQGGRPFPGDGIGPEGPFHREGRQHGGRHQGQIGVAVGRDLHARNGHAQHRKDQGDIAGPRGERGGPSMPAEQQEQRDPDGPGHRRQVDGIPGSELRVDLVERRQPRGPRGLQQVEAESVRGLGGSLEDIVMGYRVDGADVAHRQQHGSGVEAGKQGVRDLLEEDPPPRARPEASERVDVENQQQRRKGDAQRLREQGGRERDEGKDEPATVRLAVIVLLHVPEIREDAGQREEPAEHVPPFGDPGDRFDAQRMDRMEERPDRGRPADVGPAGEPQEGCEDEVKEGGVGGVQQQIRQVVADGVHPPDRIVHPQRHPGERVIVAREEARPHPAELRSPEAAIVRVIEEIEVVVPIDEVSAKRRREGGEGEERDGQGEEDGVQPGGGRGIHRT